MNWLNFYKEGDKTMMKADVTEFFESYLPKEVIKGEVIRYIQRLIHEIANEVVTRKRLEIERTLTEQLLAERFTKSGPERS